MIIKTELMGCSTVKNNGSPFSPAPSIKRERKLLVSSSDMLSGNCEDAIAVTALWFQIGGGETTKLAP